MKTIKLMSLTLKNFMGIKKFALNLNGGNANIHGDNAAGKTTLFSAWIWLLFNKDSHHNALGENVKTIGTSGLEHEVEAILSVNDKPITLRKVYYEKYTKKRGQAVAEKAGNTTDYYINDVPVQLKEYNEHILSIIDPDTFKLLTSPLYFNEQLAWKQRRDVLINLAGDVTNEEVAAADPSLQKLLSIISDRSIDDHRKVIASKKAAINKEIEQIPHRIDEAIRALPVIENLKGAEIDRAIEALNSDRDAKQTELIRLKNSDPVIDLKNKLRQAETELSICRRKDEQAKTEKVFTHKVKLSEIDNNRRGVQEDLKSVCASKIKAEKVYDECEKLRAQLRNDWTAVDEQQFVDSVDDTCPTCKQSLPNEDVVAARRSAKKMFNVNQSNELERIERAGVAAKDESEQAKVNIENLNDREIDLENKLIELDSSYLEQSVILDKLKSESENASAETLAAFALTEKIHADIESVKTVDVNFETIARLEAEIAAFGPAANVLYSQKSDIQAHYAGLARVTELKLNQKNLAKEFERLEEELFLAEQFVRVKVDMLEAKINSKFKFAKFRLFEQQINGGLNDCAELIIEGVAYSKGLNQAAQVNAGLDVIQTLSEHYGVSAPIFIDQRESVVNLFEINTQIISLIVSGNDKTLRIEI